MKAVAIAAAYFRKYDTKFIFAPGVAHPRFL